MKASGGKFQRALAALGIGILLLGACAPAAPAPTPKPTSAPTVAPTAPAPTLAAPVPTPTMAPALPAPPKPAVEEPKRGGVLNLASGGDITTFDPHTHTIGIDAYTILANYSNLVWKDPADMSYQKIIGDLATKWEMSPDGTVYTFYLR